jgi:hypothetical protein
MHQAWLDLTKFNAPTHELEKSNIGNKQECAMFKNQSKSKGFTCSSQPLL